MSAPGAHGRPGDHARPETPSQAARRVGAAKVAFDRIRLPYPLQAAAVARMDEVRYAAIGRDPWATCSGGVLVAPKGVGKSEACKALVRHAAAEVAEGERRVPVLYVPLSTKGTTDAVPTAILTALRDPRPELGKEEVRWLKAIARMRAAAVELVVFDEFNRAARRPTMSGPIALSIRERILDAGVCPVVIVGTEEASSVLQNAPALLEVLDEQIDLEPLDWELGDDRGAFVRFLADLDARLVSERLLARSSGLDGDDVARRLWEASSGRVRRLMKIVRFAMGAALHDRSPSIGRNHLEEAVDAYAIRAKLIGYNPFAEAS